MAKIIDKASHHDGVTGVNNFSDEGIPLPYGNGMPYFFLIKEYGNEYQ